MAKEKIVETPPSSYDPPPPISPPAEPPARHSRSYRRGVAWPIILIGVGVVLLLNNLHIWSINWMQLAQFWPVILILLGLDLIIGRRSPFGALAVAALAALAIGGIVWLVGAAGGLSSAGLATTRSFSHPLGDAKLLRANLNLGAGQTVLRKLSEKDTAVRGSYTASPGIDLDVAYASGNLTIRQRGNFVGASDFIGDLDLALTDAVPLDLNINAGVGQATFDLTGLLLEAVRIKAGVGEIIVTLPHQGAYNVDIDAGVGSLTLVIPNDVAARINYRGGLSALNAPRRFAQIDDHTWQSDGFDKAAEQVTVTINSGVGSVTITD